LEGFGIATLTFSPDGKRLAGTHGERAVVWDAATGKRVFSVEAKEQRVEGYFGCGFTRDGERVVLWTAKPRTEARRLVGQSWELTTGKPTEEVTLFDVESLKWLAWEDAARVRAFLARIHPAGTHVFMSCSPDGERLIFNGGPFSNRALVYRTSDRDPLVLTHGRVSSPHFAADWDRGWVATAGDDRTVKVWDVKTGQLLRTFHGPAGIGLWTGFRPGTTELLSLGQDLILRVWDAAADPDATRFRVPDLGVGVDVGTSSVSGVWAASADLSRVVVVDAVGDSDHSVAVWDTAAGRPVGPPTRIVASHLSFAFAADNRTLLVTGILNGRDEVIRRIDPTTGRPAGPDVPLNGSGIVTLSRDGSRALAWGFTPAATPAAHRRVELGVFDAATGKLLRDIVPGTAPERVRRLSAGGDAVLVEFGKGARSRVIDTGVMGEVWPVAREPEGLDWRGGKANLVAVSPGWRSAVVRAAGRDAVIDLGTGGVLADLELSGNARGPAEFSPDGRLLARWVDPSGSTGLASFEGPRPDASGTAGVRVWDAGSGRLVLTLPVTGELQLLQFSADGRKLLAATRTQDIRARKRIAHVQIFDGTRRE
jgi:WD40 repeat protein